MRKLVLLLLICSFSMSGQFLKTEGKQIVDEQGQEVILRGLGLGGWMLQEGYMMQSSDVADTQHEFRNRLVELMGEDKTQDFYDSWLANYATKPDIDSLAKWGYNSVRLPMHYNLYTLPIEDEPVQGENTWLETGFEMTDNLLEWCKANNIYLILDLHAAPGGQGANAAISDYDPSKPSLWESEENKAKTVALWGKLAERYKDEPMIGGYDLINEVNWDLPGGVDLRDLYVRITDAIRAVDQKHIIYIEGNDWANNFTGLQPAWDSNMVYSFHKYWSYNDQGSIQWVLDLRDEENVPLWMGEGGENGNVWFNDAISLFERNGIGWSFWPMKRIETIVAPYSVPFTDGYKKVLAYWRGEGPKPTEEEAYGYMMELAEKTNSQKNIYNRDVADTQIRLTDSDETKPYAYNEIPGILHLSDYDMGKNGIAYYDTDVANYSLSTGEFTAWNSGWFYRNDGVDIEVSENEVRSNGFNVGFTKKGEWMKYTVNILNEGIYKLTTRVATQNNGGVFHLELDDVAITTGVQVESTGGWQSWSDVVTSDIILPEGKHVLKFYMDEEGFNISSILFEKTAEVSEATFDVLDGQLMTRDGDLNLSFSLPIVAPSLEDMQNDLTVTLNGEQIEISAVGVSESNSRVLEIDSPVLMFSSDIVKVSYNGESIVAQSGQVLPAFEDLELRNSLDYLAKLPGRLEAENFLVNEGFGSESCEDDGGGYNLSHASPGDYTEYEVYNEIAGNYKLEGRFASQFGSAEAKMYIVESKGVHTEIGGFEISSTGGWQTWESVSTTVTLPAGFVILRFEAVKGEFNTNYFDFSEADTDNDGVLDSVDQCPNTVEGATVDVNGCEVFSLPASNFNLSVFDETCVGENNGSFQIETEQNFNYTAVLDGASTGSFEFTNSLKVDNLVTGAYSVCVTVDGEDYELCFDFVVGSPSVMEVSSQVQQENGILNLQVDGVSQVYINHNGSKESKASGNIQIPLTNGNNTIIITSEGGCQEEVLDVFFVEDKPLVYPNPYGVKPLNVAFPESFKGGWIRVYDLMGLELFSKYVPKHIDHYSINVSEFSKAELLVLKIEEEGEKEFSYKIKK